MFTTIHYSFCPVLFGAELSLAFSQPLQLVIYLIGILMIWGGGQFFLRYMSFSKMKHLELNESPF